MAEIVQIGDLAIRRKDRGYGFTKPGECKHVHLTLDDHGDLVQCDDCKAFVSAYWALKFVAMQWERKDAQVKAARAQLEAENAQAERVTLRATRLVDGAWRSRNMVPTCPHCHEPVFPEDGMGKSLVNKEIALARRAKNGKGVIR